jgi:hypothetical protein
VAEDHGNHPSLAPFVPLQRPLHFDVVAVSRRQEVGAHEQQDHIGSLQLGRYGLVDFASHDNPAVMERLDHTLPLEHRQVLFELVAQILVGMRVREEYNRHGLASGPEGENRRQ